MAKQEKITPQQALESIYGLMKLLEVEQLNKLLTAVGKIPEKINVNATLAERDRNLFKEVRDQYEAANRRFAEFCKLVSSKKAWFLYLFLTTALSAGITFLIAKDSAKEWAHRALVAAEEAHMESPAEEYSKAFVEMRDGIKARKDCKARIKGMESEAERIKDIENILADYTEEELEVRKYKISIKAEQMARLICYHPSTDQMINYRIHTTTEGVVTKVEVEKMVKGKSVWVELKLLEK